LAVVLAHADPVVAVAGPAHPAIAALADTLVAVAVLVLPAIATLDSLVAVGVVVFVLKQRHC